jgi:hypothetical protein
LEQPRKEPKPFLALKGLREEAKTGWREVWNLPPPANDTTVRERRFWRKGEVFSSGTSQRALFPNGACELGEENGRKKRKKWCCANSCEKEMRKTERKKEERNDKFYTFLMI